jgi:PAS domain S-box-containing protein
MTAIVLSVLLAETMVLTLLSYFPFLPRIFGNLHPLTFTFFSIPVAILTLLCPTLVLLVLRPISRHLRDRQKAEDILKGQEKDFRTLAENSPDLIMRYDRQLQYLYVNRVMELKTGVPQAFFVTKTDRQLGMRGERAEKWEKAIRKVFATGQAGMAEIVYPEFESACFEARLVPEQADDGSVVSVLVISRDVTDRKKAETEMQKSHEQLRSLSAHLQAAREEERTKIAREIHDELGQALATLAMDVGYLDGNVPPDRPDLTRKLASMLTLIQTTIRTVQRVCSELRPVMLDDLGLAAAMEWQAGQFRKRAGIECRVQIGIRHGEPDRERATALFRIFQEALTNVVRHAGATRVTVRLDDTTGDYILQVTDDGRGITPWQADNPKSLGLIGMRERVAQWNGTLEISGSLQNGTTIRATIPRPEATDLALDTRHPGGRCWTAASVPTRH